MTPSSEATASLRGVVVRGGAGSPSLAEQHVLTPVALAFVADLARAFGPRIREVLAARTAQIGRAHV